MWTHEVENKGLLFVIFFQLIVEKLDKKDSSIGWGYGNELAYILCLGQISKKFY